jgi:glycosyltransferase involved in cell wall biosynthesis
VNPDEKIGANDHEIVLEPLVSIIIITYNSAKYILDTLKSANDQTYKHIELIVSDDCSSDNTVELAELWLKEHKNRFVRSEIITTPVNAGSPANCNRAIDASEGEWVKIIAGDDILVDDCITYFISEIKIKRDSRFIASDMIYINADGEIIENKDHRYNAIRSYFFSLRADRQLKLYARVPLFLNSPSFFVYKSTLKSIDCFDEEFRIYDDLPLIFKILESGIRIDYIEKKTVKYRVYENSLSRTKDKVTSDNRIREQAGCFKKYRQKHLGNLNLFDLIIKYDFWLEHSYRGVLGIKALPLMYLINFYQQYLNYLEKHSNKYCALNG